MQQKTKQMSSLYFNNFVSCHGVTLCRVTPNTTHTPKLTTYHDSSKTYWPPYDYNEANFLRNNMI